jgi:hypothetical protein
MTRLGIALMVGLLTWPAAARPRAAATAAVDDDEDLGKYRGRRVEIKGELEDFEKGKVELDRHKDYTKVKLSLKGHTEEAKVPTAWLNPDAGRHDEEFQIVARRIDVKKVKVLGSCYGSE